MMNLKYIIIKIMDLLKENLTVSLVVIIDIFIEAFDLNKNGQISSNLDNLNQKSDEHATGFECSIVNV